jgi:hypothetical protein
VVRVHRYEHFGLQLFPTALPRLVGPEPAPLLAPVDAALGALDGGEL